MVRQLHIGRALERWNGPAQVVSGTGQATREGGSAMLAHPHTGWEHEFIKWTILLTLAAAVTLIFATTAAGLLG